MEKKRRLAKTKQNKKKTPKNKNKKNNFLLQRIKMINLYFCLIQESVTVVHKTLHQKRDLLPNFLHNAYLSAS